MDRPLGRRGGVAAACASAIAFAVITHAFADHSRDVLFGCLLCAMAVWIVWRDIRDFIIPNEPVVVIGVLCAAARIATAQDDWAMECLAIGIDALVCGGALFLVREVYFRRRGFDGLGFGDVKLAAACGVQCGMLGFSWVLLGASCAGLSIALAVRLWQPHRRLDKVPFGALLAPAGFIFWMVAS